MRFFDKSTKVNWGRTLAFIIIIFLATFIARKIPNGLQVILKDITGLTLPWNYNHGIAVLLVSIFFYRMSDVSQDFSLFGNNKIAAVIFPSIFIIGYSIKGIENNYNLNEHGWAFIFCVFTLIYALMEEYTWRGFLIENLGRLAILIKAVISGILWAFWHMLIFENFNQFGGFWIFLLLCIITSIILTYATLRTKSILVPATLHALLIRTNYVTLLCFLIYLVWLWYWNRRIKIASKTVSTET